MQKPFLHWGKEGEDASPDYRGSVRHGNTRQWSQKTWVEKPTCYQLLRSWENYSALPSLGAWHLCLLLLGTILSTNFTRETTQGK